MWKGGQNDKFYFIYMYDLIIENISEWMQIKFVFSQGILLVIVSDV